MLQLREAHVLFRRDPAAVEPRPFTGSLVGAVGTQASFGPKALELEAPLMQRLGLHLPEVSCQPARDRFVEYANVLGMPGGTRGSIAGEIRLLGHNEIGELENRRHTRRWSRHRYTTWTTGSRSSSLYCRCPRWLP
ncbi:MAG: hypothetical protein NTW37_19200 [Proteobacteria bacterium]|nr:hypothetical protein [Pseudomonadota bacterium]